MKVYLDLVFMMNAAVDFLLLCIVGRILHYRMRIPFLLLSAGCGGVFACFALFFPPGISFLSAILFSPILILAAFGKSAVGNKKRFFRSVLILFGSSFLAGGICALLSQYAPRLFSPVFFFILCGGIFFFTFRYFDLLALSETLHPVTVSFYNGGKTETLRLLCDSGCLVREPISSLPVLMLSPEKFDSLFPKPTLQNAESALRYHLRYVPLRTVSGDGVVPAVMPQNLTYQKENGAPVAFCAMLGRAQSESFSGYDGVFPSSLF